MEVNDEIIEYKELKTTPRNMFAKLYRSYRQWQKRRGRQKKAAQCLESKVGFYSKFIKKGDLCFDVGANIGNRTEAFLKLGAKVVAVEPQPECVTILKEKFGGNENVVIVPKVLADTVGRAEIYAGTASTLTSMSKEWINAVKESGRFAEHNWNKTRIVETSTLDVLIQEYGKPLFCKIDVEGFEYDVLKGLSSPIDFISFEFVSEIIKIATDCVEHLSAMGPVKFNYSIGESMSLALPSWIDFDTITKTLIGFSKNSDISGDVYAKF